MKLTRIFQLVAVVLVLDLLAIRTARTPVRRQWRSCPGRGKLLGSDAERAVTLFVSVDPGRDTPDVLKSYLAYFHINSVGLTGTKEDVDAVVKQYGARYEIEQSDSAAGYHVNHSTDLYPLNQQGELARTFGYSDSTQLIVVGIRQVIRSSSR